MRTSQASGETVALDGEWRFEMDPEDVGVDERWFERRLADAIRLPGTTNQRGKSPPDDGSAAPSPTADRGATGTGPWGAFAGTDAAGRTSDHLTEPYPYEGTAWYQRTVRLPDDWADSRVTLTLERTRPTAVWVDGERVGSRDSLSTPHRYDLTAALADAAAPVPGEHTLTVRVDNSAPPVSFPGVQRSHAATEHTQTNWNGVVGDVELAATDPVWIDALRIDADPETDRATVAVTVGNATGEAVDGHLDIRACSLDGEYSAPADTVAFEATGRSTVVEVDYDLGRDPPRWDEFDPARLGLTTSLVATAGGTDYTDGESTTVGVRSVETDGTQFTVNGRTTFLRGTVDCCVFPRTGYPPTDREAWLDHLGTVAEYGLNHVRFHSWCPPEAAFEAADELGLYLQPELPLWNNGGAFEDDDAAAFYRAEAGQILEEYGDHPSFLTFALGNELSGDEETMAALVDDLRERDGRRLYAAGAYNGLSGSTYSDCDDFWITASVPSDLDDPSGDRHRVRGTMGHIEESPPSTDADYADVIDDVPAPVVAHENGQFQVYPDYTQLQKYDGALRPDNLALARAHLEAHGLLDRAAEFAHASGRLAVQCYREEIEAALRTPGFGGFELLALQDFPGQGTALVGLLDSFMDSKDLVEPEVWRSYCGPVVPLFRTEARTWTADETLTGRVQVANYGPDGAADVVARWRLAVDGETVDAGELAAAAPQGEVTDLGAVETSLAAVDAPTTATVDIEVPALDAAASWDIWVYSPAGPRPGDDDGVTVRRTFDEETRDLLAAGRDVLLIPRPAALAHAYEGQFQPDFWSYALFKKRAPPGTLGPVFDPTHPALAEFPTADHADWQWWRLLRESRPVRLEDAPDDYRSIVGAVDGIERNQSLGLVFETAVGDGGLLVSTVDLFACADDPAGRALYDSLASYVRSEDFDPDPDLADPILAKLVSE